MKLPSWFLTKLSSAMNAYLHLDDTSASRLLALSGKVVSIELVPLNATFQCQFTDTSVSLTTDEDLIADTHIKGTPLQLLGMIMTQGDRQHFFSGDISITGDAMLGQQVIDLFDALDIDWEEYLSRLIGDVPTYHISRWVKNISQQLHTVKEKLELDMTDYLHEEKEWFPTKEALQDLFTNIDEIRMETDRLETKIRLLSTQMFDDEGSQ